MRMNIEEFTQYVKDYNTQDYANTFAGYEFKSTGNCNCIFCGSKDNAAYNSKVGKKGYNKIKCFGCDTLVNIIDLVMLKDGVDFVTALKTIATNLNIELLLDDNDTAIETPAEIEARQKLFEQQKKIREQKKEKEQKQEKADKQKAILDMTAKATVLSQEFSKNEYVNLRNRVFPFAQNSTTFLDWEDLYLGYDTTHRSICILNRVLDDKHTTYNIKHREKYEYNKDQRQFTDVRKPGKWLSYFNSTTYAFPYSYFLEQSKTETDVFLVEGEKDALNLLSYGINVLTLGGVANSWASHLSLLKDKTVYIWYDNDNAGYENAIKRYNEVKDIAKEVYIVLFFHIDSTLPNKYDISDFILDKKFANKTELLKSISFSCYSLNTEIIKDIEEYTSLDLKEYYFNSKTMAIQDILQKFLYTIKQNPTAKLTVKGEKDINDLEDFIDIFNSLKNKNDFKELARDTFVDMVSDKELYKNLSKEALQDKALQNTDILSTMIRNYKTIYKEYRQTHTIDIILAFEQLTKQTGHTLAKYDDSLAIWTGTHYHVIDERIEDLTNFIVTKWMPLAGVDLKKQLKKNVDEIRENLHLRSQSLTKIHHYQKDVRIVNFTNGTLFINKKGKQTFMNIHDKKHGAVNLLDFEYNTKATCPKWDRFLNRVLPDKDDQATLMQFIGYCFFPGHDYESFLYLLGKSGANGKSVIQDVIKMFFGEENISTLNIQNLVGHELQGLANKLINIGGEFDGRGLKDGQMSVMKALTSTNDSIQIDPKHTKGYPLASRQQPKMINSSNHALNPAYLDDGVYRRALIIEFKEEIRDGEKIRNLSDRFKDELSGILALALRSLDTLVHQGHFTKSKRLLSTIEDSKDETNPIRAYAKSCLTPNDGVLIPIKFLYAHYKAFIESQGYYDKVKEHSFFKELKEYVKIDKRQIKFEINSVPVKLLKTERPYFIEGVVCSSEDVESFIYDKDELITAHINYDKATRLVYVDKDKLKKQIG